MVGSSERPLIGSFSVMVKSLRTFILSCNQFMPHYLCSWYRAPQLGHAGAQRGRHHQPGQVGDHRQVPQEQTPETQIRNLGE